MKLKPSIAIGITWQGNYKVLYAGPDANAARAAVEKLPEDIVYAEVYRRPLPWKRRKPNVTLDAESTSPDRGDGGADLEQAEGAAPEAEIADAVSEVLEAAPVEEPKAKKPKAKK